MRMTLAPQSASWRTQTGPALACVRSSTIRSRRAAEAGLYDIESSDGLFRDDLSGAGLEAGRRRQHARHDLLQSNARHGAQVDTRGLHRFDEFRIAQRRV